MFNSKKLVLGLVAVFALAIGLNAAIAGEEAPAKAKPAVTKEAPAKATQSESPIHTMMKWVAKQVSGGADCADCCPSTEKGEAAWRAWFAKKDAPLATLRDAMVADGWNADRTVGFFKKMAASKKCGEECEGCQKGAAGPAADKAKSGDCEKGCCGGCDKAKAKDGAAGPAADKAKSGDCEKGCCGGCDKAKAKDGAAGPAADKAKSGDCEKGCCGGCDKAKAKDGAAGPAADKAKSGDCEKGCCGGCDKAKAKDGAAGPAADNAAPEKAKSGCKDCKECPGCDKEKGAAGPAADEKAKSGCPGCPGK